VRSGRKNAIVGAARREERSPRKRKNQEEKGKGEEKGGC